MIHQLLYISFASGPVRKLMIKEILAKASVNNPKLEVTGILICNSNIFMQLLEGKKENVEEVMERIKADSRHDQITIVYEGENTDRLFPNWSMAYKDINDFNKEILDMIIPYFSLEKAINSGDEILKLISSFKDELEESPLS